MTDALSGAIELVHARLAEGVADAERELAIARQRCKQLQREMAIAKARAGYELEVPERMAIPDLDLKSLVVRRPPVEAQPVVEAAPDDGVLDDFAAVDGTAEASESSEPRDLVCAQLRPEWQRSLNALVRCDVARFPEVFARNVIVRWEGENPLAGTHLGEKQAQPVLARLAASIQPGSTLIEELRETDGNLEAVVVVTFVGDIPDHVELATRVRCVFRFDESGRIAVFFATPEELDVVDGFLILVEEGDPDGPPGNAPGKEQPGKEQKA